MQVLSVRVPRLGADFSFPFGGLEPKRVATRSFTNCLHGIGAFPRGSTLPTGPEQERSRVQLLSARVGLGVSADFSLDSLAKVFGELNILFRC